MYLCVLMRVRYLTSQYNMSIILKFSNKTTAHIQLVSGGLEPADYNTYVH